MNAVLFTIRALTPIHVGEGRGDGVIDLPFKRSASTRLPILPGQGNKGVLRAATRVRVDHPRRAVWEDLFGPEFSNSAARQGMVSPQDAHLVAFPVSSAMGLCAWVCCPFTLGTLREKLADIGQPAPDTPAVTYDKCIASDTVSIELPSTNGQSHKRAAFGDIDCVLDGDPQALRSQWACKLAELFFNGTKAEYIHEFKSRLAIVDDSCFQLLAQFNTEVHARIRRDEQNPALAADKALWYEEYMPEQSLFAGLIGIERVPAANTTVEDAKNWLAGQALDGLNSPPTHLQLGGKASVGKGDVAWRCIK
ncbi:MAG: type III-B CRISPR module RAMP protein Cmr4 [Gammaproteobacteria bacterium]